jgi:hypothetical protein
MLIEQEEDDIVVLIRRGYENSEKQSIGSNEISGVYQVYIGSEKVNIDGNNMYYILNSKGIILIALGGSSGSAFYDVSGGIRDGRIMTGNYIKNGKTLTFMGEAFEGKSIWNFSPSNKTITKSDKKVKLVFVENL